jgi:glutaredoxin 2
MALGYLKIPFKSTVLRYDDESTPISLTGVKQAPFIKIGDKILNESLDILLHVDKSNILKIQDLHKTIQETSIFLDQISTDLHNLCMPYWAWTPEFDDKSRAYFINKKSKKRGPFSELVKNRKSFESALNINLKILENKLTPFYNSSEFSIIDILIASHLWGLYVLPEFQFSEKIHAYLLNIKNICNFNYHEDFWR